MSVSKRKKTGAPPKIYASAIVDPEAELGRDTVIGSFCFVAAGARLGAGTRVQSHVAIWDGVTLGDDVFVGPSATFTNVRHPRADFPRAPDWDETVVEAGATIGANAVLVAPVRVGTRAVVAAGAVVNKDVPAHAIVAGAPARVIGWACTCGETVSKTMRPPRRVRCARCDRAFSFERGRWTEVTPSGARRQRASSTRGRARTS